MNYSALIFACAACTLGGCVSPKYVEVAEVGGAKQSNPREVAGPELARIPLTQGADSKLYLTVSLNGHEVIAAVDTGASPSIFDRGSLDKLGVTVKKTGVSGMALGGRTDLFEGTIESLEIGEFELRGLKCAALDFSDGRKQQRDLKLPEFILLLGSDFLAYFRATIDFETKTLVLRKPDRAGANGQAAEPPP
jgi:predicted aspartyl protease